MLQCFTLNTTSAPLPLGTNTNVDQVDTYIGNNVTSTFNLIYKNGSRLGATIQVDTLQYYLAQAGFTKTSSNFTLSAVPRAGAQIYAPGVSTLTFSAYDVASVPGNTTANISQIAFIIADITEIQNFQYIAYPTLAGIQVAFVDLVTALGSESAWVQIASATPGGTPGTFQAAGQPFLTTPLTAFGQLVTGCGPGSNISAQVTNYGTFTAGDYVMINPGFANTEVCHINALTSNGFTVDGMNFAHATNEPVYTCGRMFFAQMTVPINQFSGQAQTVFELGLQVAAGKVARA